MTGLKIKISMFINYFLFAILLNSIGTIILQVQHYFGASPSSTAMIELFKDISIGVTSFLGASLLTHLGYKKSMLLALALAGLACLAMPLLKTFTGIKILFSVCGASFALTKMSVLGTLGLITQSEKEYISTMNFIESFFMVGIVCGYFIFSRYIDDRQAGSASWFNVYFLLASMAALAFVLLWSTPLQEEGRLLKGSIRKDFSGMLRLILMPTVVAFVICAFLYVVVEQSIMSWLPTYNNKVLQLPSTMSVQVTSILAGATALGRLVAGIVMKRFNWFPVLLTCLVSACLLVIAALQLSDKMGGTGWFSVPAVAFLFPLIGFFLAPIYPAINAVVLSSLPKSNHAWMSSLIVVFSALGGMLGSLTTGFMFEFYGGKTAFYFSLIPMTLLMTALFVFDRSRTRRQADVTVLREAFS
ncbi:MAG: MFS transporter [Bacteroidetes bacterium]|nr:MAG: MFS transporter [Bacteroidota bacterium]